MSKSYSVYLVCDILVVSKFEGQARPGIKKTRYEKFNVGSANHRI